MLKVWKLRISLCKMLGCDGEGGGVRTGRKIGEIACAGEEERVVFTPTADICEECEVSRFGMLFQSPNEPT
jgi:hypothetical protein